MLWKLKKRIGKEYCIIWAAMIFLLAVCLFSMVDLVPELAVLNIIISCLSFVFSILLFVAAFEEPPERPTPFLQSLDDEGKHIWTNGSKNVQIDEEGNVCSEQTLTEEEVSQVAMAIFGARADFYSELTKLDEYEDTEKKIRSKLELLQLTRFRHLLTEEEYKQGKGSVIMLDLSELWDEYDLHSYDEISSAKKKIKYLDLLKKRQLIDESEYTAEVRYVSADLDEPAVSFADQDESPITVPDTGNAASTEKKTKPEINYQLEDMIINRQMEIEDSGEELTPVRRLRILKELFNDGDMTLEEYKDKKETVILIYLDDFLEEIEYQETDSKVAFKRKMNYVKSLYQDNLIDTEEFESIKAEIMEDMDEEV